MQILLISGFLGAGKTTFIKEIIKRTDKQPVILENEYGDNNLDSLELQNESSKKDNEIKILEFMEGCVCCTMKDSFVNSVFAIYSSISPDYLIIEPTGVGRLSSIIENLKPLIGPAVSLLEPIVVLSPQTYRNNMKEWPELYTDQVANAKRVVFSKCENIPADEIKEVADEILKINPGAEITYEHYSKMDQEWWDSLMQDPNGEGASVNTVASEGEGTDSFSQVSITKAGLHNPGQLIQILEDCLRGEFGHVARAKGTLWVNNEILRFDLADRMYAITDSPDDGCQCVFIGKYHDEKKLRDRMCGADKNTRRRVMI